MAQVEDDPIRQVPQLRLTYLRISPPILSLPLFFYHFFPILYYLTLSSQPLFFLSLIQVGNSTHVFLELPPVTSRFNAPLYSLTISSPLAFIHFPIHPFSCLAILKYLPSTVVLAFKGIMLEVLHLIAKPPVILQKLSPQ